MTRWRFIAACAPLLIGMGGGFFAAAVLGALSSGSWLTAMTGSAVIAAIGFCTLDDGPGA